MSEPAIRTEEPQWRVDLAVVAVPVLWQAETMQIEVTKPIDEFIRRQLAKGYSDPGEVARQALLRWMEEEEFDPEPPRLAEKLEAARKGKFKPYNPQTYGTLPDPPHEARG